MTGWDLLCSVTKRKQWPVKCFVMQIQTRNPVNLGPGKHPNAVYSLLHLIELLMRNCNVRWWLTAVTGAACRTWSRYCQHCQLGHGTTLAYWPNVLLHRCISKCMSCSVNMNIDKNVASTANQCHNQCLWCRRSLVSCHLYTMSKYIFATKIICHWLFDSSTKIEQAEV